VVAAINGSALGGGFEICLCCHHRIAWDNPSVKIGLPEVNLGLLPGGGGIVRSTKLLGLAKALPYLLEGKLITADQALAEGFIDETVPHSSELITRAKQWILNTTQAPEQLGGNKTDQTLDGNQKDPALQKFINDSKSALQQKTRGLLPAPHAILEVAAASLTMNIDEALSFESQKFAELVVSPQAKNMISAFFFQINQVTGGNSRPQGYPTSSISKIGILGAGMMGQGIALVSAKAGIKVILKDVSLEAANSGKIDIERILDAAVAKGRMSTAQLQQTLQLITPSESNADMQSCDFIIEAVFEDIDLKNNLSATTEPILDDNAVWASNTSTLPISQLAQASSRAENYIGMHFFSPVDRMPLVEIICGKKTSEHTLAKAFDFARQIRKTPIVVNDSLGFFTSRTISTSIQEAAQLLAEGIAAERIESIGEQIGWPVGPLALQDEVSQKLSLDIIDTQVAMGLRNSNADPTPQGTTLMRSLLSQGRGGRRHGGGYYEYNANTKRLWPGLTAQFFQADVEISDEDIHDRLLFRPVIETLLCLQEGVLRSVADGNIGSILGIGAPTWTGGYIQFINTYGLKRFTQRCNELQSRYGKRFTTPTIVTETLNRGDSFS
jgi:3-hydroxyacyl-CoA dehydrogenase/enoyl-CoA hydratase/3-hydroxybutyryl-CoA epimerase